MGHSEVVDTFPQFLDWWPRVQEQALGIQIERWASEYMAAWPELLAKQQDDYGRQGEDWRLVAAERIFPFLAERLPAMEVAHQNLLAICGGVYGQAQARLGFDCDAIFVLYAGIGCGAGWVTTYSGMPAILFGLEMIAECGWGQPPAITGLIAHEIGHLAHSHWRIEAGLPQVDADHPDPWWQLLEEGFAQRCEHVILGEETWHMQSGPGAAGWLAWCKANRNWLAAEFLRVVGAEEPVRAFFGSWYDLRGWKQTGYFLGHELVRALEARLSLREIALLQGREPPVRSALEAMAGS